MLTRLRPNVSSRSPLTPVLALTWLLLGFAAAPALAANPAAPAADRPGTGPALRVEDRTVSRDESGGHLAGGLPARYRAASPPGAPAGPEAGDRSSAA